MASPNASLVKKSELQADTMVIYYATTLIVIL